MITSNSLWSLVGQTDVISKLILLLLLGMSLVIWTIFLYKLVLFYKKKKDLAFILEELSLAKTADEIIVLVQNHADTLAGYHAMQVLAAIKTAIEDARKEYISPYMDKMSYVYMLTDKEIDHIIIAEQRHVSFITTSAVVSPLIGLFGTVWGLIHAFIGISHSQSADIVTVAPGIAEALITTLAGLVVAIPAVFMTNYITTQIDTIEEQLVSMTDLIVAKTKSIIADKKG